MSVSEYLSLEQAETVWSVSQSTIVKYVMEGVICDIKVDNNRILLPRINKPHNMSNRKFDIYKEVIRATVKNEYVDYLLMRCTKVAFSSVIQYLIKNDYFLTSGDEDNISSNTGLIGSPKAIDWVSHPWRKLYKGDEINLNKGLYSYGFNKRYVLYGIIATQIFLILRE